MTQNAELPQEIKDLLAGMNSAGEFLNEDQRSNLAVLVLAKRDEARDGRKASGIEETWLECEEAYLGIDDENRAEFGSAAWIKPTTMDGPLQARRSNLSSDGVKATAFVRLTSRYVDAGAAKLGEIALPVDAKAFSLKATPVPEMADAAEDDSPVLVDGQPAMRAPTPDELPPQPAQPAAAPGAMAAGQPVPAQQVPLTVKDLAKDQLTKAEKKAKKAETRIYDWMVEYNHPAEMRKVIFDGARIGTGVLKGPIPKTSTAMKYSGGKLTIVQEIKPAGKSISPWNIFPDPGCGEDIHDGEYLFELDSLLPSKLAALAKMPEEMGYDAEAIRRVLAEGPEKCYSQDAGGGQAKRNKRRFNLWHFYGRIKRSELAEVNRVQAADVPEDQEYVYAIVTLVNDSVVRAILNPLDTGSFPFHVFRWRRRAGHWTGVGVAEQIRTPQRMANAATRRLLDNAGKSAGSLIALDPDSLESAHGGPVVIGGGDTLAHRTKNATSDDIRKLIATFQVPNMTPQLMEVIQYAFKLAEEQSSIPLVSQGQSGDTTPDTFGGQQLQDSNANQLLRDVGAGLHDDVTDPYVKQMYEYLLLDPDVPEDEKGDMQVDVSGAIALIEKAMQRQVVAQMVNLVGKPGSRIDPAKWEESFLRMNRLVPSDFQYSDEDWEKLKSQPPPKAPAVEAAEIRAQAQVATAKSRDELAAHKIEVDTDRDLAYTEALRRKEEITARLRERQLAIQERTAELNYQAAVADLALRRDISLDDAKTELAKVTMTLNTQVQLADANRSHDTEVANAAAEPPGRADKGQAFTE